MAKTLEASDKFAYYQGKIELPELAVITLPDETQRQLIKFNFMEFESLSASTKLPFTGEICIDYLPKQAYLEFDSLYEYLAAFKNNVSYYEKVIQQVSTDILAACDPIFLEVSAFFERKHDCLVELRHVHGSLNEYLK